MLCKEKESITETLVSCIERGRQRYSALYFLHPHPNPQSQSSLSLAEGSSFLPTLSDVGYADLDYLDADTDADGKSTEQAEILHRVFLPTLSDMGYVRCGFKCKCEKKIQIKT